MESTPAFLLALWFGIMTSISPCPLATNIAAVSFISKRITHPILVLAAGIAYTIGRMAAYTLLGWLIVGALVSIFDAAQFLQGWFVKALGPLLILTGLVLLEVIKVGFSMFKVSQEHHNRLAKAGWGGAFVLGFLFALAFCPVSAGLFFGSLIPLAMSSKAGAWLALSYGIGTGLPVIVFALAIALGVRFLGRWFNRVAALERYTRKITGAIFILVGVYYLLAYTFKAL